MSDAEAAGIDLARTALRQARADAKKRGDSAVRVPAQTRGPRGARSGREPLALGSALTRMMDEHAWQAPAAGGAVLNAWPQIAGDLAAHVTAVAFDAKTGQLDVAADSAAYALHVQYFTPKLIERITQAQGAPIVRAIRVLRGRHAVRTTEHQEEPQKAPTAPENAETRRSSSDGYLRALGELRGSRIVRAVDPLVAAAIERQNRSSAMKEPPEVSAAFFARLTEQPVRRTASEMSHLRALAYARAQRGPAGGNGSSTSTRKGTS